MFEIVEAIHKALGIESTWAFVLLVGLGSGLVGGFFGWVVDTGYKKSPEYKLEHLPDQPQSQQAAAIPLPNSLAPPSVKEANTQLPPTTHKRTEPHTRENNGSVIKPRFVPTSHTVDQTQVDVHNLTPSHSDAPSPVARATVTFPPTVFQKSAYQQLKDAQTALQRVDALWSDGDIGAAQREVMRAEQEGRVEGIKRAQDMLEVTVIEKDTQIRLQWGSVKGVLDAAVHSAIRRMQMPGPKQISPNEAQREELRYEKAVAAAMTGPSVDDIRKGQLEGSRFAELDNYLKDLEQRLGEYPEQITPQ